MSRKPSDRLDDAMERLERVLEVVKTIDFDAFVNEIAVHDAVIYNLGIVGEAVKGIPQDLRAIDPSIAWSRIAGLRDILFHVYFGVSDEVLWQIVTEEVPTTLGQFRSLREKLEK